jgi:hypothetical protein
MPKRTSPNAIQDGNDLSQLGNIVQDKRNGKRAGAKKSRRNRHYEKQLIRNAISAGVLQDADADLGFTRLASDG